MAQDLTKLADRLAEGVRAYVSRSLAPLLERFAAIETTVAALPGTLKGEKGDRGERGAPGIMGEKGQDGPVGAPGPVGPMGERGAPGERGERGEKGEPGGEGPAGPSGERGLPGERGEKGEIGPVGPRGEPGPMGEKGERGERGEAGRSGVDGVPGQKGDPGERGPAGERGEKGDKGDPGERGERGIEGPAGPAGERGLPGERGEKGDIGPVGPRGEAGAMGEKGERGERGERGEIGPPGADGPAGRDADPEIVRAMVAAAVQQVPVPKDGRDGRDGEPGRDAVHVEIVDGIELGKRYGRNTFAAYGGGLVRSFKATDPLSPDTDLERAGWHVVVRGIDDLSIELGEDLRSVHVRCTMTGGRVVERTLAIPALIDRGIFKSETRYEAGDVVTWDGSMWVCRGVALDVRPGIPSGQPLHEESLAAWRLAVKRGRDGRDGVRGEKGERGAEGRPGRDLTQMGPDGKKW